MSEGGGADRITLNMRDWYLVRTKTGGERVAQEHLKNVVQRTLLPLGKTQVRQRDRTFQRVSPIFPSYLFASFSLACASRQIRYTPGVRDIVRFGEHAAVVPLAVIDELISRCGSGPIDISKANLSPGASVKVIDGAFRDFDAVFDGYLSGSERIAVLLSVMNAERRVVMRANMVVPSGRGEAASASA